MFLRVLRQGLRFSFFAFSAIAMVMATACSDDKSPPDDGKDGKNRIHKSFNSCDSQFRSCAQGVLDKSGLDRDEQEALSGCGFAAAKPRTSSEDLFEVARATIKAHCL